METLAALATLAGSPTSAPSVTLPSFGVALFQIRRQHFALSFEQAFEHAELGEHPEVVKTKVHARSVSQSATIFRLMSEEVPKPNFVLVR